MSEHWVFNIGTGDNAPPPDWISAEPWRHHAGETWFPPNKRPTGVRAGDRAVIHGSGGRGFLAVVEVLSTAPEDNVTGDQEERARFPFRLRYKLLVAIPADERAPSLQDVDWDNPRSLRRQSHIRIDPETYGRIARAIVDAAAAAVRA